MPFPAASSRVTADSNRLAADVLGEDAPHLTVLAAHELGKLQQLVGSDEGTLHDAIALIRSLDPKPGLRFGAGEARFVIPDVLVSKIRGKWTVIMNPAVMPRLRINRGYETLPVFARRVHADGRRKQRKIARRISKGTWPPSA